MAAAIVYELLPRGNGGTFDAYGASRKYLRPYSIVLIRQSKLPCASIVLTHVTLAVVAVMALARTARNQP